MISTSILSPRDRRALLWGGVIVASGLIFAYGVKPYFRALTEVREELSLQQSLLARERSLLNTSNRLSAALEASGRNLRQSAMPLFTGVDELAASASLSDQINRAAASSRVQISQLETREAQTADGVTALAIDFRGESDFEGILRFLNALERSDRLMNVTSLAIQRLDRPYAPGVPDMEVLAASGTITGYGMLTGSPMRRPEVPRASRSTIPASATTASAFSARPDTL